MISVTGLTKTYGPTTAVRDLTFEVASGRVTGFLGPNGAGKSTTMRMILGLDHPTAGSACIDGSRYRDLNHPLRQVGALLGAQDVHPRRTARAHLFSMARSNRIPTGRADEVLELVGLAEVGGKRVGSFSMGMAQRLGIASALIGDPHTVIFDEPLNGLDPDGVRWVRALLRSLAAEGRTVFVSSHLMSEMQLTADHLVVIGKGRLVADLSLPDMIAASSSGSVLVRVPERAHQERLRERVRAQGGTLEPQGDALVVRGHSVEEVGDLAFELGVRLRTLRAQEVSLEEAYMQMTAASVEYGGRQ